MEGSYWDKLWTVGREAFKSNSVEKKADKNVLGLISFNLKPLLFHWCFFDHLGYLKDMTNLWNGQLFFVKM